MTANTSAIADSLFTKTQQRVLGLLYGKPDQSYYLNEIVRLAGVGKGSIVRELDRFCEAGLLSMKRVGNQNHYQANTKNPIYDELRGITQKTFGVVGVVQTTLEPLLDRVDIAFIYGSIAKGTEHADSDIDLMLVADDLSYGEVMSVIPAAEKRLGRTINPTLYSRQEFSERLASNQNFIKQVMDQPKLWLTGIMEGEEAIEHGSTG